MTRQLVEITQNNFLAFPRPQIYIDLKSMARANKATIFFLLPPRTDDNLQFTLFRYMAPR